jgi:hypothetical protein
MHCSHHAQVLLRFALELHEKRLNADGAAVFQVVVVEMM